MKSAGILIIYFTIGMFVTDNCFGKNSVIIKDSAFYFSDTLHPNQIKFTLQDFHFLAQKDRSFNFGLTTNTYCYIIIKVEADKSSGDYVLSIDNTSLDSVLIYNLVQKGDKQLLYQGGNQIKYDTKRAYVWHTIPLKIHQEPEYYLIAIKAPARNVNVAYKIIKGEALQKLYQSFDRIIYFYTGIISLISFISLVAFLLFKRKGLVIFSGYILAVTAWILAHYGYLYPGFYPFYPSLNEIIKPVALLLAALSFLWLITYLFKEELKDRFFRRLLFVIKLLNSILFISAFLYLFHSFTSYGNMIYNIIWHIAILISVCVTIITLAWLFNKSKTAKIFSIAVAVLLVMAIIQIISNVGFLHNTFLNDHGILIGALLQILILSYGICYSIWNEIQTKGAQLSMLEGEQKKALQMLINVQNNERKRIAEDLHDSIGPMLAAIKINFMRMVKAKTETIISENLISKTERIIDGSINEIRNVSHQLMPKDLSAKGLITVLSNYFNDLQIVYNTNIVFMHEITATLSEEVQLNLFRIISELVLNACKHSCSENIVVSIKTSGTAIQIMVQDDGKGFKRTQKNITTLGITNAEGRVAYLKGNIQIDSAEGKGTIIQIFVPQSVPL